MQAFPFKTGKHQTSCQNVPNDGILIQTPEGVVKVQLWINEVKIKLGSTAFIQASSEKKTMSVTTLEGAAHVEALGVEQVAVEGTTVTVRIDENLMPVAPPSLPKAYILNEVRNAARREFRATDYSGGTCSSNTNVYSYNDFCP